MTRLRGAVVLVHHTAEDRAALHRSVQRHDDPFVMLRWPLLPGLVPAGLVVVPGAGSPDRPQVCFAIDQHPAVHPARPVGTQRSASQGSQGARGGVVTTVMPPLAITPNGSSGPCVEYWSSTGVQADAGQTQGSVTGVLA